MPLELKKFLAFFCAVISDMLLMPCDFPKEEKDKKGKKKKKKYLQGGRVDFFQDDFESRHAADSATENL
jgi:hypothetical protein